MRAARPEDVLGDGRDVVLFADTFNRYFERENLEAAERVLNAAGYRLHNIRPSQSRRPLCCGRAYLSSGMVEEARCEARRVVAALSPYIARGARIVGREPSCLFTFRDELTVLLPKTESAGLADASLLVEELLAADLREKRISVPFNAGLRQTIHLHGHCHQKAFGAMEAVETVLLRAVPGIDLRPIESSCCGMAGAFGYNARTIEVSFAMGELSLFPALRAAGPTDIIVADGTSCRHQIRDGTGREAVHAVRILDAALHA